MSWKFAHRNGNPELFRGLAGDSGWTTALTNIGVITSGNKSLYTGHDVAESKYVHQVTGKPLHILMKNAFNNYVHESTNQLSFDE